MFTLPATPSSLQLPLFADACAAALEPMNPAYPTLWPEELTLFGVVMHFIHRTRARL
ncbi:hypothetical protein [Klebsiella quasipneumoniae]|uniref:hypothetical protein n=1 Tax=Klebsiella quasipneumoniae TaxID=1463165 RepID=UPI0021F95074|nr:hypothetical protein KAM645c_56650 [Klebsiella quasipneumoniae subsp. quasipneumoniae]